MHALVGKSRDTKKKNIHIDEEERKVEMNVNIIYGIRLINV